MVSFELGKEINKDVFRLVTSVGVSFFFFVPRSRQDEKHLSLHDSLLPITLSKDLHCVRVKF